MSQPLLQPKARKYLKYATIVMQIKQLLRLQVPRWAGSCDDRTRFMEKPD
jgi:hypothetical protein